MISVDKSAEKVESISNTALLSHAQKLGQHAIVEFFAKKSAGQNSSRIPVIETHGAWVFIIEDDVYKIKKAVHYPFMDFSTLEKRRKACENEILLNRPFAPDIYLSCVPITCETTGEFEINGSGEIIEWAVHMRRFDQENLLSHKAQKGALSRDYLSKLAKMLSDYHNQAPIAQSESGTERCEKTIAGIVQNFTQLSKYFSPKQRQRFSELSALALEQASKCLDLRAKRGFIRRCHGDLHLGNILDRDGLPVLFDALEFDDELATTDILYDLAFLCMDLIFIGRKHEANFLLNRYLIESQTPLNLYGLRAFGVFIGCRAAIRACTCAFQAEQISGAAKRRAIEKSRAYYDLAMSALAPPPPQIIAIGGFSGTGKTTLAAKLAPLLAPMPGAVHLRSDIERKRYFDQEETQPLPARYYDQRYSDQIYDLLMCKAYIALRAGHCVIIDAVFAKSEERDAIERVANKLSCSFTGLWLTAEHAKLKKRVAERVNDASDATTETVEAQIKRGFGPISWTSIAAGGTAAETFKSACHELQLDPNEGLDIK